MGCSTHSFHREGGPRIAERIGVAAEAEALAQPLCAEAGLRLVDVESARQGGRPILRFVLDKPGGISTADLESFHRRIARLLEASEAIRPPCAIEVSSPGLERELRRDSDFEVFRGRAVQVATREPVEGRRALVGRLDGLVDGCVVLTDESGRTWRVPREQVARTRLWAGAGR